MSDFLFARSQMAMSLAFHIIYAAVGMGMPLLMAISEWRYLRTGDAGYLERSKRWAKGVAILFAIGQVTLIILGWAFAQYPFMIPGSLTYMQAAAPGNVLWLQFWALLGGMAILIPSLVYLFRTFKKGEVFVDH